MAAFSTLEETALSEGGVRTQIRYGISADSCTLTSAPSYTEEGQYTVYYEITYTYQGKVTAPTCTEMGFTVFTCSLCGDTYKGEYTKATGHKSGDWIIDKAATTTAEGSKHKECTVCGVKLDTAAIEKIYNQATTDSKGEAVVGGYLVIVTDTSSEEICTITLPPVGESSASTTRSYGRGSWKWTGGPSRSLVLPLWGGFGRIGQ